MLHIQLSTTILVQLLQLRLKVSDVYEFTRIEGRSKLNCVQNCICRLFHENLFNDAQFSLTCSFASRIVVGVKTICGVKTEKVQGHRVTLKV